jgi:membrane-associated phospholipid phosphatase
VHAQLTFESLATAFFIAFGIAALATGTSRRRRGQVAVLSLVIALGILAASRLSTDLRGWLGHAYLIAGYWIPALLVPAHSRPGRFEAWLVRGNERWRTFARHLPPLIASNLELSYLLCYVLVPIAFGCAWAMGSVADVDRFWTAVLASGFMCYGSLPWLISRPPRMLHGDEDNRGIRGINRFVLARVSHGLNTFPSGHVAVSLAAALEVFAVSRPAGIALVAIAAAIAAGAVVGRYHYGLDVLLGAALGILVSWLM